MGQGAAQPASGGNRQESHYDGILDGDPPVSETRRRSKLSTITNIFKPWKWRKKKSSEKFQETSAVLERKISTRQSREELIQRGVLKEIASQAGGSEVTFTNGCTVHDIPVRIEPAEGNGPVEAQGMGASDRDPCGKVGDPWRETQAPVPTDYDGSSEISAAEKKDVDNPGASPALPNPTQRSPHEESQSGSSGTQVVELPPADYLGDHADAERSQHAALSDPEQRASGPSIDPTQHDQPGTTDGMMDTSQDGATSGQGALSSGVVDAGSSERPEVELGMETEEGQVQLGPTPSVVLIPNEVDLGLAGSDFDSMQCGDSSDEEDDEESLNSALAIKTRRRDTLANKLQRRPTKEELEEKNILPQKSSEEWTELRKQIGNKLNRRLSQRPSLEELEQRNILR
ncbi:phosphatase and actin regulator 2-like isoform X2 [Narcine bancroftii]